jgi:hypothetical protein
VRKAGIDRAGWKPDFELAARQPLFVDREPKPAVLEKRGA